MSKTQYGVVLMLIVVAGLIGGAVSNQLAQWRLFPQFFLPRDVQTRRGFEIIDNQGRRRVLLDKSSLTFFGDDGEQGVTFRGSVLTLYDKSTNSSVQLSPYGPYVIRFAQSAAPHSYVRLPERAGSATPKLGVYVKDGQVIWEVP